MYRLIWSPMSDFLFTSWNSLNCHAVMTPPSYGHGCVFLEPRIKEN